MSTFDSTKRSLPDLLRDINEGKIQLPDFQRGWVWDDEHIQDLLVSIARSFPVGAVMLLETGGDVRFQVRPVEGLDPNSVNKEPEQLILDGQQRLTTLTQAIALPQPVKTRTSKGKEILRHYYFDIKMALEGPERLDEAILAVDEHKQLRSDFGRQIDVDVSTRQKECELLLFPCDQILNSDEWEEALQKYAPDSFPTYMNFRREVINAFRSYQLPIIELKKETTKEAVCLVFEKVNTGGVQLSVFELVTASYAADGYNLRDDWLGSEIRNIDSRQKRIAQEDLLKKLEATDFLQAITLLHTQERKQGDISEGKQGKQIRPTSAKRSAVLELPLTAYTHWVDAVEEGFRQASFFLRKECFYSERELPYRTQIIPLAAVMTLLKERWREPVIYQKLSRWFWCGVLGELYGGAVETRMANDLDDLLAWLEDDTRLPRTVTEANFQAERLESLRTRVSAAYKAINILVLRDGAQDFFWRAGIQELDAQEVALDIHHIFPRAWCEQHGIPERVYDNIINKTPISYKANRKIGGSAPSVYLQKMQDDPQVRATVEDMDAILAGHKIPSHELRSDDFYGFVEKRKQSLVKLINKAMGA